MLVIFAVILVVSPIAGHLAVVFPGKVLWKTAAALML